MHYGPCPGNKLGPYEIQSPLGAGEWAGCIARATRGWREMSRWKSLPEAFAADSERMARFEREAKVPHR